MRFFSSLLGAILSEDLFNAIKFFVFNGRLPDLQEPQEFHEKVLWLKMNQRSCLLTRCADKYSVRQYVADAVGDLSELLPAAADAGRSDGLRRRWHPASCQVESGGQDRRRHPAGCHKEVRGRPAPHKGRHPAGSPWESSTTRSPASCRLASRAAHLGPNAVSYPVRVLLPPAGPAVPRANDPRRPG